MSRQSRNVLIGLAIVAIISMLGVARWRGGGLPSFAGSAESARIVRGGTLLSSSFQSAFARLAAAIKLFVAAERNFF